jgi:hypothetical protein
VKILSDKEHCPGLLGGIRVEVTLTCTKWAALQARVACLCDESFTEPVDVFLALTDFSQLGLKQCIQREFLMKEVSRAEYIEVLNRVVHAADAGHLFFGGGTAESEAGIVMLQGLADFYNAMGYSGHAIVKRSVIPVNLLFSSETFFRMVGQPLGLLRNKASIPPAMILHVSAGKIVAQKPFNCASVEELRKQYLKTRETTYINGQMSEEERTKYELVKQLKVSSHNYKTTTEVYFNF